ncbi:MAG: hypothetical protein U0Q22_04055 [Acidimicrobiales bacterium]
MSGSDTTIEAAEVQREALRRMGPDGRLALAFEMSEEIRLITLDGLAERHSDLSQPELVALLIELWHGPEFAQAVRSASGTPSTGSISTGGPSVSL